jgi:hypothetical protein
MAGRPRDTFGEPITRLIAWTWLCQLMQLLGARTLKSLENCLTSRSSTAREETRLDLDPWKLHEIADDGADPEIKKAAYGPSDDNRAPTRRGKAIRVSGSNSDIEENKKKKKDRVSDFVNSKLSDEERGSLEKILKHPVWAALRSFTYELSSEDEQLIQHVFSMAGVLAVSEEDANHIAEVGLYWPEEFRRPYEKFQIFSFTADKARFHPEKRTPQELFAAYREAEEKNKSFSEFEAYAPARELKEIASRQEFATLDGIFALLMKVREHRNVDEWGVAKQLREALTQSVQDYSYSFFSGDERIQLDVSTRNEYLDSWGLVLKTCVTHRPIFAITDDLKQRALEQIIADFSRDRSDQKRRGRPSRKPSMDGIGKVGRRWRRRIFVRACNMALSQPKKMIGFVRKSECTEWLVRERDYIEQFVVRAAFIQHMGSSLVAMINDPELSQQCLKILSKPQALRVPEDEHHRIIRPSVSAEADYRMGQAWDHMYLIPTLPYEVYAHAVPFRDEDSTTLHRDEVLAEALAKELEEFRLLLESDDKPWKDPADG